MKTELILNELTGLTYPEVIGKITSETYEGDCCGYAEVSIEDNLANFPNKENAILKFVTKTEYDDDGCCSGRTVVNFVFDLGDSLGYILGYELTAGSGSGWSYGAYCTLSYGSKVIAEANW